MKQKKRASRPESTATGEDGQAAFIALRQLLLPYRSKLHIVHDDPGHFYANCARPDARGKPQFFGAVKVSGGKTLFHFMPVYDFPDLLDNISPVLRKRMQGKSCFNFDVPDPAVAEELAGLVVRGVERYRDAGKL